MPEGQKADLAKKKALSESNDDLEMAKFLTEYNLTHRSNMIKPRGLSNRSNWCFVNAILQALVACPPFYNLMKAMPLEILKKASMTKITKVVQVKKNPKKFYELFFFFFFLKIGFFTFFLQLKKKLVKWSEFCNI